MDHLIDDSDRLMPCPFCGAEAEIITLAGETDEPSIGAQCVQCTSSACGAASGLIYPLMDDVTDLLRERWAKSLEHAMFIVNAVNHLHRARLEGTWPPTLGTEFPRWRDVADEPPQKAQEVLFVHGGKTVHGAWIGGAFWHNNQRCSATTWLPLPTPPKYDVSGTGRHSEK